MNDLMFSIIVVSLNSGRKMENTLLSVLHQTYDNYEIIIKDGMSADDTLLYIPEDQRIHLIKQKDKSVYDGMNQALQYAKGKFFIFMNCGDSFADNQVLFQISQAIKTHNFTGKDILYGDYIKSGKVGHQTKEVNREHLLKNGGLCHQTIFFGREVFKKCGDYDLTFPICADYEFMLRAYINNIQFIYIPICICIYEGGGLSERPEAIKDVRNEGKKIRKKYFSKKEIVSHSVDRIIGRFRRIAENHKRKSSNYLRSKE